MGQRSILNHSFIHLPKVDDFAYINLYYVPRAAHRRMRMTLPPREGKVIDKLMVEKAQVKVPGAQMNSALEARKAPENFQAKETGCSNTWRRNRATHRRHLLADVFTEYS